MCAMLKDFDPTDYSIVVKTGPRCPSRGAGRSIAPASASRSSARMFFESREKASATGKEALARLLEKLST